MSGQGTLEPKGRHGGSLPLALARNGNWQIMMLTDPACRNPLLCDPSAPAGPNTAAAPDPLFSELVGTRAFQRLRTIRFLGGIDYLLVRSPNRNKGNVRHTRYQHSLGVARLALLYCDLCGLPASDRRLVFSSALLHDIGHGPLSHSLEPVFKDAFGLEHHQATEDIITGRVPLGREIYDTLRCHHVPIDRILALIAGHEATYHGFFSGPINFDTIEGILRAQSYVKSIQNGPSPEIVTAAALRRSDDSDRDIVDGFWLSKDHVYRYVIHSSAGILADYACALFMHRNLSSMGIEDYFSTESQIFHKLPGLRQLLTSPSFETEILQQADGPIRYKARRFFVEPQADFFARYDNVRYRQASHVRLLAPHSAGAPQDSTRDLFHDEGD
jgi:hypothetical protein